MKTEIPASEMIRIDRPYDQPADTSNVNKHVPDSSPVPTGQPGTEIRKVSLDAIKRDEGLQARVRLDSDTIADYAADMQHGAEFPPIVVFEETTEDGTHYWLGDGWHRVEAAVSIGAQGIRARIFRGNRRDALIHAAGANAKNGLRHTNADKQKAVKMLLRDEELVRLSNNEISRMAGVHRATVDSIRKALEASCEIRMIEKRKVTRQGTTYVQRAKHTEGTADSTRAQPDDEGVQPHPPQAENEDDLYDGNPQAGPVVPSGGDCQSERQRDNDALLERRSKATAHHAIVESTFERTDGVGRAESQEASSDELPETQASQAPLPALHCLLERIKGDVCDFRAQHACDEPIVIHVLDSLEEGLQRARRILETDTQHLEHNGVGLDVKDAITPGQNETIVYDNHDGQDRSSSSEEAATTVECLDPAAVVQTFLAKRCTPASNPVSHRAVMEAIHTWLDGQGYPRLDENEVNRAGYNGFCGSCSTPFMEPETSKFSSQLSA